MIRKLASPLARWWRFPTVANLAFATMVAATGKPASASAQPTWYNYQGLETQNPSVHAISMSITLTEIPSSNGGFSVAGTINNPFSHPQTIAVKGTFNRFTRVLVAQGTWTDRGLFGTGAIGGSLSGGDLGAGAISITTSIRVPFGAGALSTLSNPLGFRLTFFTSGGGNSPGGGGRPGGGAPNQPPLAGGAKDFHGIAGFGYTNVDLQMRFVPSGTNTYSVTGQIVVHALRPQDRTTVMQIAGRYDTRSIPAQMTVTGAPQGNSPRLTCTIVGPNVLQAQLSGIPALGIFNLYFTCRAP